MFELRFNAMGSQIEVLLDSDKAAARQELEMVPIWFENWEQILSRFREDSELARVNRSNGQWMGVSDTFWKVLEAARVTHFQSGGLVTPMLLREMEEIGYKGDFATLLKGESQDELWQPSGGRGSQTWEVDMEVDGHLVQMPSAGLLDFGGVAKGWAAQECAARLAHIGPVLVNAGGDIAVSAPPLDETGWEIGVENLFEMGGEILSLSLRSGGLATSGTDRRRWQRNGILQHHIIDPRSGKPAESDVLRSTVIAPNAIQAEMAAKMVLIMGSQEGLDWLNNQALMSGMLIMQDNSLRFAKGFDIFQETEAVSV